MSSSGKDMLGESIMGDLSCTEYHVELQNGAQLCPSPWAVCCSCQDGTGGAGSGTPPVLPIDVSRLFATF